MTTAAAPLQEYLRARRVVVDEALARFLPSPPECPAVIAEAMRYSLFAGGKRLRPVLTLAAADTVAGDQRLQARPDPSASPGSLAALALPAACALELIHTYSLIHDDLPAMDDDTLRRGRPTNHVVYGEGMAILAGDGLLTEAFALLARDPRGDASLAQYPAPGDLADRVRRTIRVVAVAAGAAGMVGGQAIDLQAAGSAGRFSIDALRDMHARKTGALIKASVAAGAIMAGGSEPVIHAVERYGSAIGLAFQIVDDILDVEGASEDLGKTAGKDAAAGKPTYPALLGLERSRALARDAVDEALGALASAAIGPSRLQEIAAWVLARSA